MTHLIQGLYVLVNREGDDLNAPLKLCEQVIEGGADVVQYRDKEGSPDEILFLGKEMSRLCHEVNIPFILNDHVNFVKEIGADGIHIGQKDLALPQARERLGNDMIIGVSVANVEEAEKAIAEGADYLGCGPVYPTPTKQHPFPEIMLNGLQQVVAASTIPVIAIGGINKQKVPEVMAIGVAGVAVISAISRALDPLQATKELKERLNRLRMAGLSAF